MEIALIENLQRENLNPIEEALGYRELMENYNLTQAEVSTSVGKSRSAVANTLRLLNLPKEVVDLVQQGSLSSGHARALLGFDDEKQIIEIAKKATNNGMTVRDVEKLSKKSAQPIKTPNNKVSRRDSFLDEIEIALNTELHRKVKVNGSGEKGTIEIEFYNKEDLNEIAKRLTSG